ncbi:uncharacterized protein [Arachis hypogaea]|uniref:uncharacterized protein isoform X1 n=1 Tax=Arachis hypogaea TaxID=3818 RepID=UPI000DEC76EF|nr:uncharacterized protein LOC112744142 isoform X1 [Arachis hypogaea]
MEEYPEELRTPPVTLAAIVGCPELHPLISTHFLSAQPPINTLALSDLSKIYLFERKPKDSNAEVPPPPPTVVGGILKKDWLLKHRTKVPAVLGAVFRAEHVFGDPAQWLNVCSDLDSIKAVIRGRNIKLAVVIIHTGAGTYIREGRSRDSILSYEVPFYAAADERIVELHGEVLKVLKALEAVVGHLRMI